MSPLTGTGTTSGASMSAAVWTAPGRVEVQAVPLAAVPDGWALVRVAYNGICGTDLSILRGSHPRATAPLILGHEMSGWVAHAGESGPPVGTLVVAEPLLSCGECAPCRSGNTHVCRRLGLFGIDAPGALAEYVALPPAVLHAVPDHVPPRTAALAEPLAVAVHAVRLSGMRRGDTVLVHGAGPIGVLTALVARHEGAGTIVVSEPHPWRREVAAGLGLEVAAGEASAREVVHRLTRDEGADVTFDTAAHPAVAAGLADVTRVLGHIVVVGVYKEPVPIDLQAVCFKEQRLLGVRVYTSADVRRAIELLSTDALGLAGLPVRTFSLSEVAEAFAAAASGDDCLKVMVSPAGTEVDA